ncbi:Hypothetical predicted protein [Marmota monax]|uniref:Uncharacterized protein n=1 Tax=Marmota monax TaxID=9995 RepID=A0A5E4ABQ0_MARMO|nr:Hypothetical predicted protein [Marmota monax]
MSLARVSIRALVIATPLSLPSRLLPKGNSGGDGPAGPPGERVSFLPMAGEPLQEGSCPKSPWHPCCGSPGGEGPGTLLCDWPPGIPGWAFHSGINREKAAGAVCSESSEGVGCWARTSVFKLATLFPQGPNGPQGPTGFPGPKGPPVSGAPHLGRLPGALVCPLGLVWPGWQEGDKPLGQGYQWVALGHAHLPGEQRYGGLSPRGQHVLPGVCVLRAPASGLGPPLLPSLSLAGSYWRTPGSGEKTPAWLSGDPGSSCSSVSVFHLIPRNVKGRRAAGTLPGAGVLRKALLQLDRPGSQSTWPAACQASRSRCASPCPCALWGRG